MTIRSCFALLALLLFTGSVLADWPQWRGPSRNGIATNVDLPETWGDDFSPAKLWESEEIPSDRDGGHGSVSVADGKVYLSVVWHRDVPTETRKIDNRVMGNLGHRNNDLSPEVMAKFEEARMNLSPRLRGAALREWSEKWADENLDEKQLLKYKGWVVSRFKQGKTAIPWADLELIVPAVNREFTSAAELKSWVEAQAWKDPATAEKILTTVPNTKKEANDVVICLNLEDGSTLWKFEVPGHPTGRTSSSTPAVADGTVYAVLSDGIYAVDATSGEQRWKFALPRKRPIACSPLVTEGRVFAQIGQLVALDSANGELLWECKDVSTTNSSPTIWNDVVICNGGRELIGVDSENGEVRWRHRAGGDATPVVAGDHCIVTSKTDGQSLTAFRLSAEGARQIWAKGFLARRYGSSPIIDGGHVYHLGSARHMCLNLETGDTLWEVERSSNLSSPLLANGKLLVYENNGGFLAMIGAKPGGHEILGRVKIGALGCSSPAIIGSKAIVRNRERVLCYDLKVAAAAD